MNDIEKIATVEDLKSLGKRMDQERMFTLELAAKHLYVRQRNGKIDLLKPNAAQRKFEELRGRQNIVLKARQMGITTWVAARFFLRTITHPGTLTVQVAHTQAAVEAIFRMVQRMWEHLPDDLRKGLLRRSRANVGQMVFPALDSEFRVWSAADINAGRGLSMQNLHCSEVSRWPGDAAATLAGLRAALAPDGELVLESTPNGASGAFYEEWRAAIEPKALDPKSFASEIDRVVVTDYAFASEIDRVVVTDRAFASEIDRVVVADRAFASEIGQGFSPDITGSELDRALAPGTLSQDASHDSTNSTALIRHFLPWWLEPAYVDKPVAEEEMTEIELALFTQHKLKPEQIGYRRGLERQYGKLRSQEFAEDAETCFRATGDCFFEIAVIDHRMLETPEPYEQKRNGAFLRWSFPQPARTYLVAVDTAGGGNSGDFCAVQIVNMETGLQAAELQQRLRPSELADVIVDLASEYNDALIAVERNNTGYGVLAHLIDKVAGHRVYKQNGEPGWYTSAESKEKALNRLNVLLTREPNRFMSQRFLGECRTFVNLEGGKLGAAGGAHDDLVMAMAIAQAVREEKLGRK